MASRSPPTKSPSRTKSQGRTLGSTKARSPTKTPTPAELYNRRNRNQVLDIYLNKDEELKAQLISTKKISQNRVVLKDVHLAIRKIKSGIKSADNPDLKALNMVLTQLRRKKLLTLQQVRSVRERYKQAPRPGRIPQTQPSDITDEKTGPRLELPEISDPELSLRPPPTAPRVSPAFPTDIQSSDITVQTVPVGTVATRDGYLVIDSLEKVATSMLDLLNINFDLGLSDRQRVEFVRNLYEVIGDREGRLPALDLLLVQGFNNRELQVEVESVNQGDEVLYDHKITIS